jgi:hypothetical protein
MIEVFETYLKDVRYRDWDVNVLMDGERAYLQIGFWEFDNTISMHDRHAKTYQKGRKWTLSPYMTKSEVVQTAFKAIMTAEEHEIREKFTYRGKTIFGPHFNVDMLAEMCEQEALDVRQDSTLTPTLSQKERGDEALNYSFSLWEKVRMRVLRSDVYKKELEKTA